MQVRERPFGGEFRLDTGRDFVVACRQTGVRVVVLDDVPIAVKQRFKHARVGVPGNLFIATRHLSYAVVAGGIPLNLLPNSVDANVLDEGHRHKPGWPTSVSIAAQSCEVRWVSEVTKDTATNGEGHRHAWDQVVENTTLYVSSVVRPHVNPERLLIASEVTVHEDVSGQVCFCSNVVRLRLGAVEYEHFSYFCVDSVRCVISNGEVFWVKELTNAKVSRCGGKDVNRFNCGCVVTGPLDVNLNWHANRRFLLERDWIHPFHISTKDGGSLCIEPKIVWWVKRNERRCLVVCVKRAIVVRIPITGFATVVTW